MRIYSKSDYVDVTDEAGKDLPPVPKTWLDKKKGLLPDGVKRKSSRQSSDDGSGS